MRTQIARCFLPIAQVLCGIAWVWAATAAFAQEPLQFGLIPARSTPEVIRNYSPLKTYLERELKRRIILSTAPNFREYIRRTREGEYDFLFTSAPLARLAQQEAGFKPLVSVRDDLYGVLLVAVPASYKEISDLRGKLVATPDELATASVLGQKLFLDAGLEPGRDVILRPSPSNGSAALAVIYGTADAALISEASYRTLPGEEKAKLRLLAKTESAPGIIYLAHPRLGAAFIARLRTVLLNFNNNKEENRQFFKRTGYTGYAPISEDDMQSLAPLLKMLNPRLAQGRQ